VDSVPFGFESYLWTSKLVMGAWALLEGPRFGLGGAWKSALNWLINTDSPHLVDNNFLRKIQFFFCYTCEFLHE